MSLRSHIAVAMVLAGSCSSNLIPSLETSICHRCSPKKTKKKKKMISCLHDCDMDAVLGRRWFCSYGYSGAQADRGSAFFHIYLPRSP